MIMSLYRHIQNLKAQIIDTERLLEMVVDHPLMSESLSEKLSQLRNELESLPQKSTEPKVQLFFSGNAVKGSIGIKSNFISRTLIPFQKMVKTQVALHRYGKVGKRGRVKRAISTDLYLTDLPVGSFGVELSQLEANELFDAQDISVAMKDVMRIIENTAADDEAFEETIENTPKRNLTNLKTFLKIISDEQSVLKMESGESGFELTKEEIFEAYNRVASTKDLEGELIVPGIFRGILLDSEKFEIQEEDGNKISGFISEDLDEEQLIEYDKTFLNNRCEIHLKIHKTKFRTGTHTKSYELLEIRNLR